MQKKSSKIKFEFKSRTIISRLRSRIFGKNKVYSTDHEQERNEGRALLGYTPNIENPLTFNEKLIYLKLNYRNPLWERCADKLEMKAFLAENGFGDLAAKTLGGPYESSSEIDLTKLPEKFVLKTNHDCGSVFICDKKNTDFKHVFSTLDASLKQNYSEKQNNREWVYNNIKPIIFAEELLEPSEGTDLMDFKFFVSEGKPVFLFVASNRSTDVHFNVKDFDYNDFPCEYIYPKNKRLSKNKPPFFDEMAKLALEIGKLFDFVRVDFYSTVFGPRVGELTFFSQSGHGVFCPRKYDRYFGNKLDISFAKKQIEK